jgi:hypothetical protein
MPETEMFHNDRSILVSKFASSAAHTQGRALVGAETGTWVKEHFTETLADVKAVADDMFLSGINHIYYHGACYSPDDAPWPGWVFYASTEMNPRNPIWHDVPALNEYVARVQSVLQSGRPDNDILLYWPVADFWSDPSGLVQPMSVSITNWFEGQNIGKTAHELWNRGYAFDYVSDAQLLKAKVVNRPIQMPSGCEYEVILVPKCKYIPLETFKQLLALAQKGANVVFEEQLPTDIAGLSSVEKHDEFKRLVSQISFRPPITVRGIKVEMARLGEGTIVKGDLQSALLAVAVGPQSPLAFSGLNYVRRISRRGGLDYYNYFIANRSGTNFDGWIPFGPDEKSFVLLDPMTGATGITARRQNQIATNITEIHLQLLAGESVILRTVDSKIAEGPAWNYWQTNGQPIEITGQWNVKFLEGGPAIPAPFQTTKPGSWTASGDTNAQNFAGTASYSTTFDAPTGDNKNYFLDLGDVRQSARVKLNGEDYGTLITPPFRVVVDNLKPTGNQLEVEVTSVAANRIRDLDRRGVNWKIFKDINIVNVDYKPFDASNWPLTDCGLLGPVTLTKLTAQ